MSIDGSTPAFLVSEATSEQLMAATARNELAWMERKTRAAGGRTGSDGSVHWAVVDVPRTSAAILLTAEDGSPTATAESVQAESVERVLQICREAGAEHVTCVALTDTGLSRLGTLLGARGFRWGGRPHWMVMDLHAGHALPAASEFGPDLYAADDPGDWPIPELPLFHPDTRPTRLAMAQVRPQEVWHLLLNQDGEPVGQSTLNVTTGELGVCGYYETEILPSSRTRGLGLKRVDFIRRFALDLGCRYAVTNAAETTDTLYRVLGFRSLCRGQGWGMSKAHLIDQAQPDQIALAEAIGADDLDALDAISTRLGSGAMTAKLASGLTPLEFAARTGAGQAAGWLIRHGATCDVQSLWDLGRVEDLHQFLDEHPGIVNARRPRSGRTLLHRAVQSDDAGLVQLLLTRGADASIRDERFDATAEQWALELRHFRILRLLEAHTGTEAAER